MTDPLDAQERAKIALAKTYFYAMNEGVTTLRKVEEQIRQAEQAARENGRQDGVEEVAVYVEEKWADDALAKTIRALKEKP